VSAAVAIFVKTPGLSPIKTRLAQSIGKEKAESFFMLSAKAVGQVVEQLSDVVSYWAVGEEEGVSHELWQDFESIYTGEGDLGERLHNVYSELLAKHGSVVLMGADSPQITRSILSDAIEKVEQDNFVFGPTHDGGFYLFGGGKPVAKEIWTGVSYSQDDTLFQLEERLGKTFKLPALTDVDVEEDLKILEDEWPKDLLVGQKLVRKFVCG